MTNKLSSRYESMWTTEKEHFLLVVDDFDEPVRSTLVIDRRNGGAVILDDEDDVVDDVLKRMRDAGVTQVSWAEYRRGHKS